MSKAGVAKTQDFRKPRRKKVILEERVVDGVVVVGKECTRCDEWKPLSEFHVRRDGLGKVRADCKVCTNLRNHNYYEENKEKKKGYNKKYYEENKEQIKEDTKKYREANKEWAKEYNQRYYEENGEQIRGNNRKYYEENKDIFRVKNQRRRAREMALPGVWALKQKKEMLVYFDGKCALTGESDITQEHAIPLSIGHGGTIHGNMWPLCSRLNSSKHNKNIFEWFEANRQRFELSPERFDRLIEWLAAANEMTVEEYRDYVYWCHANPNDVLESEAI